MYEAASNQLDMREVVFILWRSIAVWRGTQRTIAGNFVAWPVGSARDSVLCSFGGSDGKRGSNCKPGAISCQSSEELCGRSRGLVLVGSLGCSRFGAENSQGFEAEDELGALWYCPHASTISRARHRLIRREEVWIRKPSPARGIKTCGPKKFNGGIQMGGVDRPEANILARA